METLNSYFRIAVWTVAVAAVSGSPPAQGEGPAPPCVEDAMIVFDASGSMLGIVGVGPKGFITKIDEARSALAKVLPDATRLRRVGLITYGPGPYQSCNVRVDLGPTANAARPILRAVDALSPAGRTPLASAVEEAANVLDFRARPGTVVVLTDGEETCGRSPCAIAKQLHAEAKQLTVHVIGYRPKSFSSWTGEQSITEAKCLAEESGGLYITAGNEETLISALKKTLDCPAVSGAFGSFQEVRLGTASGFGSAQRR